MFSPPVDWLSDQPAAEGSRQWRYEQGFIIRDDSAAVAIPGFLPAFAEMVSGDWPALYGTEASPVDGEPLLDRLRRTDWFTSPAEFPSAVAVAIRGIGLVYWEVFAREPAIVRAAWLRRPMDTRLCLCRLPAGGFRCTDRCAGYYQETAAVLPVGVDVVDVVDDYLSALVARGVEVWVVPSLWPLHDAVAGVAPTDQPSPARADAGHQTIRSRCSIVGEWIRLWAMASARRPTQSKPTICTPVRCWFSDRSTRR